MGTTKRTVKKPQSETQSLRSQRVDAVIVRWLSAGFSIGRACKEAGIHRSTYYRWQREHEDFAKLVEDAMETGTDEIEDVLWREGRSGNVTALIFALKARRPEKYRERSSHEVSGNGGAPLTIVIGERADGPQ